MRPDDVGSPIEANLVMLGETQGGSSMHFWGPLTLFLVLISGVSHAQDQADVQAFNEAWDAYKTAMQQSRSDLQIDAARDTLAAGQKLFDPSDERLLVLMINYGAVLFVGKHQEESKAILKEALVLAEDIYGEDALELVTILSHLADAESDLYSPGQQLKHYKRALRIVTSHSGGDSDEYANLALRTGRNVLAYSRSPNGRKYLLEAGEIFAANHGEQSLQSGLASFHLAKLEFSRRRYKKATEYLLAALPAFEGDEEQQINYQMYTRALLVQAYEERGKSDLATEHCVAVGKLSKLRPNQEYQPLFRLAPSYPKDLLIRGIEGHVDFSFKIDENGFVRDPQVLDHVSTGRTRGRGGSMFQSSKEDRSFEAAALEALERFRYAPMFVDGKAVEVDNIKTRISFAIED